MIFKGKGRDVEKVTTTREEDNVDINEESFPSNEVKMEDAADATTPVLSERRKALFEPLEPTTHANRRRPSAESLLPMPDFDTATYPRGWQIGKKRKLVNVDVVESMRRIAVQEMNRQDKEIDDLNGVVEEDGWLIEHLQTQLQDERNKRSDVERENAMLRDQINMLMNMLQDGEAPDDESPHDEP
ncbi:protein HEADING DATE REPRESSOR 1 isoform X2 [Humulus lupulus]|uniref:protein HEADING DATE REPRESSOR 1 isoform X2 n=1 Tax=Humulus lupulus TaxID=3486 RepID=UPI002B412399|nr:protein HEADING DATE REPRESSOR 1 isoform X2 [Humulus lupulus]